MTALSFILKNYSLGKRQSSAQETNYGARAEDRARAIFGFFAGYGGGGDRSRPHNGQGNRKHSDQVAVEAMREVMDSVPMRGRIVIGEGERDEAPMLYIGEE